MGRKRKAKNGLIMKKNFLIAPLILLYSCLPIKIKEGEAVLSSFVDKNLERKIASENSVKDFNNLPLNSVARIADRKYVFNVLLDIFGPINSNNQSEVEKIKTLIRPYTLTKGAFFSGGCSPYEASYSPENTPQWGMHPIDDKDADCSNIELNSPNVGAENTIREALRTQACEVLVDNQTAIYNLLTKVLGPNISLPQINTPPNQDEIIKIYQLFYPATDIPASVLSSQLKIAQSSAITTPLMKYKLIALTFCLSPDWQIP